MKSTDHDVETYKKFFSTLICNAHFTDRVEYCIRADWSSSIYSFHHLMKHACSKDEHFTILGFTLEAELVSSKQLTQVHLKIS